MSSRKHIDAETFVKAWMESGSIQEVEERLGIQANSAQIRASRYRKMGVNLPKFHVGRPKTDVTNLNKLVQSYGKPKTKERPIFSQNLIDEVMGAPRQRKDRTKSIALPEFVNLWNHSRSYTTLMKKLGCTGQTCVNYRRRAVAAGYELNPLKGTRRISA